MSPARTPESKALIAPFHRDSGGNLLCESTALSSIAEQYGTPTFVYAQRAIESSYQDFARALGHHRGLICYAMKANPSLAIVRLLARQGAGVDIVSGGELSRALAAGVDPGMIVFSGVGKSADEIKSALACGIKCINVESTAELLRVNEIAGSLGVVAPVSLRVNPDIDPKTHPYISTGLKENKFGIPMEEALDVYRQAHAMNAIRVAGIDCHIGSQITSLAPFMDSLEKVLGLADALRNAGIEVGHLDLGGGLGICYENEAPPAPQELLAAMLKRVSQWAKDHRIEAPEVLFEFGRALVGNAGLLVSRVEILKTAGQRNFAVIDAAMNDLLRPALYDAWHAVETLGPQRAQKKNWDLVGPVCESGDWIAKDRTLGLAQGDLLAILSAGAYGMSMSSNYNSRGRAAEVLVDCDGRVHPIRRRETFADLIGPESIPSYLQS